MKIIPAIDLMDGKVVRLTKGDPSKQTVYSDDPLEVAKAWVREGADALHVVDLNATLSLATNHRAIVERISRSVSVPVQAAGGIRSFDAAVSMLEHVHAVVLATLAFKDEHALTKLLELYGYERIIVALDHEDGIVKIHGWRDSTGVSMEDALKHFSLLGVKRFLVTDTARDGTMLGLSNTSIKIMKDANRAGLEIIASGGIATLDDVKIARDAGAYAVILGKALYEGRIRVGEAKRLSTL
ncbi:1-(5-phosphoribosyl)-5-[(5-phosphoribosylamino) methylideneamino] imidazole-4-carboxamide isomerase [archaeon HR05]|nr:1-(5-phosphoribosyl)-5-[(5-phosphoribosylamino) methylideneamino] imidazole-4-carboxamide isomerase [archaeon HR05]